MGNIKLISKETIKDVNLDFDRYIFEAKGLLSTKDISIVIDFKNKEIAGDIVAYGGWHDLELPECLTYLKLLDKEDIIRDFDSILKKEEK